MGNIRLTILKPFHNNISYSSLQEAYETFNDLSIINGGYDGQQKQE